MKHELPVLPYALDALAPKISKETMEFHYGKHHKAYVDKLNELIAGTKFEDMTLEEVVKNAEPGAIFNNAAQAWNHTFYFLALSPKPSKPSGALGEAIEKTFGGLDGLKKAMTDGGVGQFGSGWVWLTREMKIEATPNAAQPKGEPLLTLDVWEHAYYIDYRNRRADHLTAAFDLVDWAVVGERYEK